MGSESDLPATYRIRVKGYLDDRWSDRLGSMEISAPTGWRVDRRGIRSSVGGRVK